MSYILPLDCTLVDVKEASKEKLFYTWKAIENGAEYPLEIISDIVLEMTLRGM